MLANRRFATVAEYRESEIPEPTAPAVDDLPLSIPPVFAVFPAELRRLAELATWAGMEGAERHRWRSRRLLGKLRFPVLDEDG